MLNPWMSLKGWLTSDVFNQTQFRVFFKKQKQLVSVAFLHLHSTDSPNMYKCVLLVYIVFSPATAFIIECVGGVVGLFGLKFIAKCCLWFAFGQCQRQHSHSVGNLQVKSESCLRRLKMRK
uniref:Transmembrane protein n=1 Tax=Panagrellus redivivus TaxID=6233 RepID=A0A7E4UNF1_PANRE